MRAFLDAYLPPRLGEIVLSDGTVVGQHDGIEHFTIGQRRGLVFGGDLLRGQYYGSSEWVTVAALAQALAPLEGACALNLLLFDPVPGDAVSPVAVPPSPIWVTEETPALVKAGSVPEIGPAGTGGREPMGGKPLPSSMPVR